MKLTGKEIAALVGHTPMVPVTIFSEDAPLATVAAKMEFLNPGGSIKDRPVARILLKAQERGELDKGKVILDSSSGNAGISYALLGQMLGYQVELVMPGNVSAERLLRIRAHGAQVVLTDPLEGYDEALRVVNQRYEENSATYFFADQYANGDNWLAHYETTAEEILKQSKDVTHFVAGIGTGGSITGISRRLKEQFPLMTTVCVRPQRFPGIEGLKPLGEPEDIVPDNLDASLIDQYVDVTADQARDYCHRLARSGLFAGHSSGAYMAAVDKVLQEEPRANVVTLLNDTGERYASTGLWSDENQKGKITRKPRIKVNMVAP